MNDVEIMSDDGKFTADFKPEMLGEDYKNTKFFETTPNLVTLMKSAADTKAKIGEMGKELEKAIQRPGEDATDQEKADYRKSLQKELGAPETVDAYDLPVPEGQKANEEFVNFTKEMFLAEGVPVDSAARMAAKWNEFQAKTANDKFVDEAKQYKQSHAGDKLVTGARTAIKAMIQFADADLKALIKETKILDNPADLDELREMGIWPSQLAIWENIGERMKSDAAITNEGEIVAEAAEKPKEGTTEAVVSKAYDHPSSKADRKARGKNW
jgi:hypothetical protein